MISREHKEDEDGCRVGNKKVPNPDHQNAQLCICAGKSSELGRNLRPSALTRAARELWRKRWCTLGHQARKISGLPSAPPSWRGLVTITLVTKSLATRCSQPAAGDRPLPWCPSPARWRPTARPRSSLVEVVHLRLQPVPAARCRLGELHKGAAQWRDP